MPATIPTSTQPMRIPRLSDVEAVEETSARETNRTLRTSWHLIQSIHAHDGAGGYPVYIVSRVRARPYAETILPTAL